jgi:hypothetical protein
MGQDEGVPVDIRTEFVRQREKVSKVESGLY